MNILLMGLESRTDFEGNTLSAAQLTETHSGSDEPGGNLGAQDTDTLILIHVFAGGQKAVGYSIPRDDVVNYPHTSFDGVTEGKIDGAYNYAYNQYVSENIGKMGQHALYQGANEAGQVFQVQTVESVTGVHIDHFVVSNIYGFELIAQELGGLEVCLKPAPKSIEPDGFGFGFGSNLVDLPFPGPPTSSWPATRASTPSSTTATTRRRAARSTCTCRPRRRWRSSAPGTRCPGSTSAGPTGSRRPSTTSSTTSSTGTS